MGNLRACFAVAVLAMAASCGEDHAKADAAIVIVDAPPDAKQFFDAPPPMYDFTCMGNAAPTTATAQITLGGTVQRAYLNGTTPAVAPRDGATLKACKAGETTCTGQNQYGNNVTSAGGGNFSIGPINTSMMPLDAYIEMTDTGSRTTYVYPPSPFTADQGMIPVLTFDPALIQLLGAFTSCTQMDTNNGIIALAVTDCAQAPIDDSANVMISIKQGGSEVQGTDVVDLGMLQAQAAGTFLICNVPANATTTVDATYNSMSFREHDVKVVAGATTATLLRPGY